MERYGIQNRFNKVSLEQFQETALKFQEALNKVRPNIRSKLLLTTNSCDYYGAGSLTIITPETEAANKRREQFNIEDLTQDLWLNSFDREFYVTDESVSEPYMLCISNEIRDSKRLLFYGQCLDDKSQKIFSSFRKSRFAKNYLSRILQKVDNGSPVTSPAMLTRVFYHLK